KFLGGRGAADNIIVNGNDHNVTSDGLNVGSSMNISSSSGVKTANRLMRDVLNVGSPDELNSNKETGTNDEPCSGSKVSSPSFAAFKRKLASKRADRALSDNVVIFVPREQGVKINHNHPEKQQFKPVKSKTARGDSTSTNTLVSNVFEVLGDLEDDGFTSPDHFDLLTKEDGKTILLNLHESDDDADVEKWL
nr:hypothetical protein [Tanacetum cinerariifolium]